MKRILVHKPLWPLIVLGLGLGIIALHFHSLWTAPMNEVLWGISLSADPIGDLGFAADWLAQSARGCADRQVSHDFPFGTMVPPGAPRFLTVGFNLLLLLARVSGQLILSFNMTMMAIFLINYLVIYLACYRLLADRVTALVPAVLVSFSTYAYAHSYAHLGLMHLFFMPGFLASMVLLWRQPSRSLAFLSGGLMGFSIYASPYYAYFLLWTAIAITIGHACHAWAELRSGRRWRLLALAAATSLLVALPYVKANFLTDFSPYWGVADATTNYGHNLNQLLSFTARPSDYLLPNINNVFFGAYFAPMVQDPMPLRGAHSDELPIYLGVLPLLFCFALPVLLVVPRARRWLFAKEPALVTSLLLIMLIGFLLSLPHQLYGVPLPNELMRRVLPFRSYSRFAMLVLVAVSILIAVKLTHHRHRRPWTVLLIVATIFESFPAKKLHAASATSGYLAFLRERPEQVIMRFEAQNSHTQRQLDLDLILTGKRALNGEINFQYGYSDLPLRQDASRFRLDHLGAMGAQLLLINGRLATPPEELEFLAYFAETNTEIWRFRASQDATVRALFQPLVERALSDLCQVVPKPAVQQVLASYYNYLLSGASPALP